MQVIDLLPAGEGIAADVVERWVSAELSKALALRDLDDQLYPDHDDPVLLDRAHRLHAAWRQWAEEAGALLQRILSGGVSVSLRADVLRLRQEVALAVALVKQSPEMVLLSLGEARAGDVITIEEARRELRTSHHAFHN
jgi:hypothetical protein